IRRRRAPPCATGLQRATGSATPPSRPNTRQPGAHRPGREPSMTFRTIDDLDLADKRVLVRVDINVPVRDGRVTDVTRMEAIRPTIRDIVAKGGRPILLAHFGRPEGEVVPEMSLGPLAGPLSEVLGLPVDFSPDCIGEAAEEAAERLEPG